MTRRRMNVEYDGIGFINNRGTSKYWGVCKALNDDKNYRITFNDTKYTYTYHPDRKLGRITEQTAARLAAALYKYRFGDLPVHVNVEVDGTVYRLDSATKKIYTLAGKMGLYIEPVNEEKTMMNTDPVDYLNKMMDKYNVPQSEQSFVREVFNKATGEGISIRGQSVLKAVLKSVL